jgi:hypothetical protein
MPRAYIETILSSKPGEAALILCDQLRIERRLSIARNLQLDPAGLGRHRLAAVAVAAVAGLIARQMMIHLGVQGRKHPAWAAAGGYAGSVLGCF